MEESKIGVMNSANLTSEGQQADDQQIGVGVIGYGIGRIHSHAWYNIPRFHDRLPRIPRLEAICAGNKAKVSEMIDTFGFKKGYSDYKEIIRDPRVGVLDVCTPPNLHPEHCIASLEAGKPFVVEKPLASSADEAYDIYRAGRKTGVPGMTGFNYRFIPGVMLAKELVESGRIGRVYNFRCCYLSIESGGLGWLDPNYPLTWRLDEKVAGHGAVQDLGSHIIDMAMYLLGDVVAVTGASETIVKERPLPNDPTKKGKVNVDDVTVACMKFRSGAIATIDASWMVAGKKDYFYFELYGSEGAIRFDYERLHELDLYLKGDSRYEGFRNIKATSKEHPLMERFWPDQGGGFTANHMFVSELAHFVDRATRGQEVSPQGATLRDGYVNNLIVDSIVESVRRGSWINVEPKS